MPVAVQTVLSQNITLVYDALELGAGLDRNRLRQIVGADALVMDTHEMIVAAQPANVVIFQLGDRRIRITTQQPAKEIGMVTLWILAHELNQLAAPGQLTAYGFNFDALVETTQDAKTLVENVFSRDRAKLEQDLGGALESLVPRIHYVRDTTRYDLVLQPQEGKNLLAHLNAHMERRSLPPQNVLEREYKTAFREFISTVERIVGDENA